MIILKTHKIFDIEYNGSGIAECRDLEAESFVLAQCPIELQMIN